MYKILVYLLAIQHHSKNIHYHCAGSTFFSDHLLADRIFDGLQDLMDEINEKYYMGKEEDTPQQTRLLEDAAELVPEAIDDMTVAFKQLDRLILSCIDELETVAELESLTVGDNDLIGRIGSDMQQKHGFLWRRLK